MEPMTVYSLDGMPVEIPADSHAQDHGVLPLAIEAIGRIELAETPCFRLLAVDMERVIGTDNCVPTWNLPEGAEIYFARRGDRTGHTRMVRGVSPSPSSTLALVLGWEPGRHVLYTAFVGCPAPREPWDPNLSEDDAPESYHFWHEHALVDDGSTVLHIADGVPEDWR